MTIPAPEFSRPVRVETLGALPRDMIIEANEEERSAVARRFGLLEIRNLAAQFTLKRSGTTIRADGRLQAEVTQACVASGAPVEAMIDEPFQIQFTPPPGPGDGADEEVELSAEDCDTIFYTGGEVDVGEAAAETLALSLDPWPRAPDADEALKQAGIKSEDEVEIGPFAALAGLRDSLKK